MFNFLAKNNHLTFGKRTASYLVRNVTLKQINYCIGHWWLCITVHCVEFPDSRICKYHKTFSWAVKSCHFRSVFTESSSKKKMDINNFAVQLLPSNKTSRRCTTFKLLHFRFNFLLHKWVVIASALQIYVYKLMEI